jgi:hypothetical protein
MPVQVAVGAAAALAILCRPHRGGRRRRVPRAPAGRWATRAIAHQAHAVLRLGGVAGVDMGSGTIEVEMGS